MQAATSSSAAPGPTEAVETTGFCAQVLDGTVTDTKSLVAALNCSPDWMMEEGAREWFNKCIELFSEKPQASITQYVAEQYSSLGSLAAKSPQAIEMLQAWLETIWSKLDSQFGYDNIVSCLNEGLQCLDRKVFAYNPALLIDLANLLLDKLDPKGLIISKDAYPTRCVVLFAIHSCFALVGEVAHLNSTNATVLLHKFKKHLSEIAEAQHYYPFRYHAFLIEQTLERLEESSRLADIMKASSEFLVGLLRMAEGIRGIMNIEFKHDAFAVAFEKLKASSRVWPRSKQLHISVLEMHQAGSECVDETGDFGKFEALYNKHIKLAVSAWRKKSRLALRFCLIEQLRMLAAHSAVPENRSKALQLLLTLSQETVSKGPAVWGWTRDDEIFEALLDAFTSIYVADTNALDQILEALSSLEADASFRRRMEVSKCRDDLLRSTPRTPVNEPETKADIFLDEARNCLTIFRKPFSFQKMKHALQRKYREDQFANASSISKQFTTLHVKDLEFLLMRI